MRDINNSISSDIQSATEGPAANHTTHIMTKYLDVLYMSDSDPSRKVSEQCLLSTIRFRKKSVKNLIQIIRKMLNICLNTIFSQKLGWEHVAWSSITTLQKGFKLMAVPHFAFMQCCHYHHTHHALVFILIALMSGCKRMDDICQ